MRNVDDPRTPGTRAHLAAFVRGTCTPPPQGLGQQAVILFKPQEDFIIPADGAWFVNGVWLPPGTERPLVEGDRVRFEPVRPALNDDRPVSTRLAVVTPRKIVLVDHVTKDPIN